MAINTANPYLQARLFSQIGRIQAAQELALAESTLKNYELGLSPVPDSTVLRMSYLYRTPWLRVQHLQKNVVFLRYFWADSRKLDISFWCTTNAKRS